MPHFDHLKNVVQDNIQPGLSREDKARVGRLKVRVIQILQQDDTPHDLAFLVLLNMLAVVISREPLAQARTERTATAQANLPLYVEAYHTGEKRVL